MLNKTAEIILNDGFIFMTSTYKLKGVEWVDHYVDYRKKFYLIRLKKGKTCTMIEQIRG